MQPRKSNRDLPYTISQCLISKRMQIAVDNFKDDPMFMKALLTELCLETFNVTRSYVVKRYNIHSSLDAYELAPLLRSTNIDDLNTFNLWFGLSPLEQALYIDDPKNIKSAEEKSAILAKIKKNFMGE